MPYFYQKIDSLILGSNVTDFDVDNIYDDTLQYIECRSAVPPVMEGEFSTRVYTDVVVVVPVGCKQVYQNAPGWSSFWNIVEGDFAPTAIERIDMDEADFILHTESGGISLSGAGGQSVRVYDLTGRLVKEVASYEGQVIVLPAGSYVLRVGNMAKKIML